MISLICNFCKKESKKKKILKSDLVWKIQIFIFKPYHLSLVTIQVIHTKKRLCRFLVITDSWCEFQVSSSMRILVSHRNVSVRLCRMPCRSLWAHSPSVLLLQKSFAEVFPTSRARPPWRLSRQSRSRTAAAASPTFKCQTAALPDTRASLPVSVTPDGVLSDLMWLEQTKTLFMLQQPSD